MGIFDLIILAVGLSMDAFAVAICKGLAVGRPTVKQSAVVGGYFGTFQAGMPLLGYLFAALFAKQIEAIDHWVVLGLLVLLGTNMIREAFSEQEEIHNASFGLLTMLPLALATSIDAMAVGITFALEHTNLFVAALLIGMVTFVFSALGVRLGGVFGERYQQKAQMVGGIVLIVMGIKFLLEGIGIIA